MLLITPPYLLAKLSRKSNKNKNNIVNMYKGYILTTNGYNRDRWGNRWKPMLILCLKNLVPKLILLSLFIYSVFLFCASIYTNGSDFLWFARSPSKLRITLKNNEILPSQSTKNSKEAQTLPEWFLNEEAGDLLGQEQKHRILHMNKQCGRLETSHLATLRNRLLLGTPEKSALLNGLDFRKTPIHYSLDALEPRDFKHFIYDDKHKLVYCYVPKVACTNWKRVLIVMSGKGGPTPLDILPEKTHNRSNFRFLSALGNMTEIRWRLSRYLTFVVVRDPMERLLSAFRDKFEMPWSGYFQKVFGTKIIRKYRQNATLRSLEKGHDVTFQEFIRYLTDQYELPGVGTLGLNEHWQPAYAMCHPCAINYDVLGHYATLERDANYILSLVGVYPQIAFPPMPGHHAGNRKTVHMINRYVRRLTPEQIGKLERIYAQDELIFNYTFRRPRTHNLNIPLVSASEIIRK